jgi:dephospho-CoA kinase
VDGLALRFSIGLTGGIGSGKSTVAAMLAECGAVLVDTDAIARGLTAPGGTALPALAHAFGPDLIGADGALDRDRMRVLAFGDAAVKAKLEAVLHPMIGAEADAQAAQAGDRPLVFDVPLLAESARWRSRVDRILVIDCPEAVQVQRVVQRSGWEQEAVQRVIAQQASRARRRAIADAVIFNGEATSLAALGAAVQALWAHWTAVEQ